MPNLKQHYVSKVLLKRFAKAGEPHGLASFDLKWRHLGLRSPSAVAWSDDFIEHEPLAAEELWQEVETDLGRAIDAVEAGTAHDDVQLNWVLRQAVALHYMRRIEVKQGWDARLAERMAEVPLHVDEYGLDPSLHSPLRDHVRAEIARQAPEWFQESVREIYQKTRLLVARGRLEILHATEGEFLVSDNPVLSYRNDVGFQPLPFADAGSHLLPVSRRFAVAIGPEDRTLELNRDVVRRINSAFIAQARSHLFFHPDSGLESEVRAACDDRPRDSGLEALNGR